MREVTLDECKARAVQSVLVPRSKFSKSEARSWVASHKYKITKPPDVTDKYYRFRQADPSQFMRLRTISLPNGVKLIVGDRKKS